MAKGKNLNPADAFRKAQRKKELKKNKAGRSKARDFALVKKDTGDLQDEIEKLEGLAEPSGAEKYRLAELKAELNKIMAKKEEYVQEHPEQRKLVYRVRRDKDEVNKEEPVAEQKRNVFNKHGLPRHPERSIYYDAIMNPYGVPPPGMPYMERPLRPDETASDDEVDGDDDIVMPEGPPPTGDNDDIVDSDDDIPMPEGPPPSTLQEPPLPPNIPFSGAPHPPPLPPPPPFVNSVPGPPPFPPSYPHQHSAFGHTSPPSFSAGVSPYPPISAFMQPQMPPPPPGFFPRVQSASSMQDPLSSIPHQTYQAHRVNRLTPHPSLPQKPPPAPGTVLLGIADNNTTTATVSAAPQLRDFKKEATAFVPTSLKRKKPATGMASSKVNAAPSLDAGSESLEPAQASRPDLVSSLMDKFGPVPVVAAASLNEKGSSKGMQPNVGKKDDYQKFVEEMGDILGTSKP
ncbi:WW domain binding protein 11-domain-containing protein [Suillus fuscotomentosus]|uniref:WW domain binding protein 11-domain-containing protein n=1 Tax=Suillus fuscotomentosus TaxID=1912939 RepID=A0AAD4HVT2_9AGAM|nr:WW domain binding protein 11-domain-containing protein [Suillus fuscotomentosus]KAG1908354.1 WW domain binding protein 11-domain-containing protein [Suillus fuscotomentosus]